MKGLFVFIILCFSGAALAHPVTYKGGTMIKSMFRQDMSQNSVTYSFHRQMAVGAGVDRFLAQGNETSWGFVELNALVKRWNLEEAQANIYLTSGMGSMVQNSRGEFAGKAGIQADYETRKFYTLAQYTSWFSKDVDMQYAMYRVGFAPFVAGYNDLAIWAILQTDYNRDMRKNIQVTPLLRFYYKNILWEFGSSIQGNFFGQFMVHL
jgi:hypothetical protein